MQGSFTSRNKRLQTSKRLQVSLLIKLNGRNSSLIFFLTWWSMSSYNIIVIHICRAGFKIRDDRKAAEKEAMQPHARKRKEKELSDEDFSDARKGNGSEAESEDDGELAAKIAAQEKQLEALMSRKKVVQAPPAVINASRAILPTAKAAVAAQMLGQGEARMFRLLHAGEGESLCLTCVKTRDQTTRRKRTTRKRTTGDLHRGRVLP